MSDIEPGEYDRNSRSPKRDSRSSLEKSPSLSLSSHSKKSASLRRSYSRSRSRSYRSRSYDRQRSRTPPRYTKNGRYSRSRSRSESRGRGRDRRSPMSSRKRHIGDRLDPPRSKCLGVFGLSLYTTVNDVRSVFSRYGRIDNVNIVMDQATGRSRGFGFVYFEHEEDAEEAKERANSMELDGRRIRVDYSITKRAHTPTPGVYVGRPYKAPPRGRSDRHNDRYESRERPAASHYGRHRDDYSREKRDSYRRSPSPYSRRRSPSPYHRRSPSPYRRDSYRERSPYRSSRY